MTSPASVIFDVMLLMMPVVVLSTDVPPNCTMNEILMCMAELQTVDMDNVATKEELQSVCRRLKDGVLCVDHHMQKCFSMYQMNLFNQVVKGARQVLAELCVPGPIQEAYLRHAPCFRSASPQEDKCALKYKRLLELSQRDATEKDADETKKDADETKKDIDKTKKDVDKKLRESCCAFHEYVTCKHFHATQDCGEDAAEFQQKYLDRIASPLIHEHCAGFTYGDTCDSGSWTICFRWWLIPVVLAFCKFSNIYQNDVT